MRPPTVYMDMDGVVCNFVDRALKVHGQATIHDRNHRAWAQVGKGQDVNLIHYLKTTPEDFWHKIDSDPEFWLKLPPIWSGVELTKDLIAEGYEVVFCTSPSHNPICWQDKVRWLREVFYESLNEVIMIPHTVGKWRLARPGAILIDDTTEVVNKFRDHGGQSVLFPRWWNTGILPQKTDVHSLDSIFPGALHLGRIATKMFNYIHRHDINPHT